MNSSSLLDTLFFSEVGINVFQKYLTEFLNARSAYPLSRNKKQYDP